MLQGTRQIHVDEVDPRNFGLKSPPSHLQSAVGTEPTVLRRMLKRPVRTACLLGAMALAPATPYIIGHWGVEALKWGVGFGFKMLGHPL